MSPSQSDHHRPTKRKTLHPNHQACSACKARKVRCDAARPRCSYCTSHDKSCVYPPVYRRATCSQAHVDELEARLRDLEGQRSSSSQPQDPHHQKSGSRNSLQSENEGLNGRDGGIATSHEVAIAQSSNEPGQQLDKTQPSDPQSVRWHPPRQPIDIDQLPAVENARRDSFPYQSLEEVDDNDPENMEDAPVMDGMVEYTVPSPQATEKDSFGDSSTFNFALKIKASSGDNRSNPSVRGVETSSSGPNTAMGPQKMEEHQADDEVLAALKSYLNHTSLQYLPQRHVAVALLEKYFLAVHPVWPFLLEQETRTRFEETWSSNDAPSPMWMAQLNLIFALACQFYDSEQGAPLSEVYEAGKQFYQRGNGFVVAHAFHMCSIPMIQTLLLVAQYQQGTMRSNECWLTVGHATRMALGMGLHTSTDESSAFSRLDRELRKRLWWGCFSLDRVLSMIYGRPIGIPHGRLPWNHNNLPLPVDDRYIALGEKQPENTPSINAFFLSSVQLYRVMDEILERLHDAVTMGKLDVEYNVQGEIQRPCGCSAISQLTAILQLDGLLLSWHDALPNHLKFSLETVERAPPYPACIQRQRIILQSRFLSMRILLHRQTLLYLLQPPESRRWPRNASQKWPPLFSDISGDSQANCRYNGCCGRDRSPLFERQLAHLSANVCVSMAQLQIEQIDLRRPLMLTGAWWWDFHFIFNALCIIFGTMGLQKTDLDAILPDQSKAKNLIQRGFENIRHMSARGGPKVAQSEKFLRRLMKTMIRQGQRMETPYDRFHPNAQPVTSEMPNRVNTSLSNDRADTSSGVPQQRIGPFNTDFFDLLSGRESDRTDAMDFSDFDNVLSLPGMEEDFLFSDLAVGANVDTMENLIYNSFDAWNPLGGPFHPVGYDITSAPPATSLRG